MRGREEYRIQKLMYIKLPLDFWLIRPCMYCFWCSKSITWAIAGGGWALDISTFLGPKGTRCARCHFRAQKSLDFRAYPLKMALVMDIARLKIIKYRPIKTTGTLIVIMDRRPLRGSHVNSLWLRASWPGKWADQYRTVGKRKGSILLL